jgi:thiol:disulfide interchange protein DsbD
MAVFMAYPDASKAQLSSDNALSNLFEDEPEFLPVEQAFAFEFAQNGDQLVVTFDIADNYYLYKKQFKLVAKNAELGEPIFPPAEQIEDEFFGISDVFYHSVVFTVPIKESIQDGVVKLRYQGCAKAGLCYPPTTQVIYLSAVGGTETQASSLGTSDTSVSAPVSVQSEQYDLADRLTNNDSLVITLLLFLALGIGLAFTPCVFPMYPILSSIVIGQGKELKLSKAFWLSFIYVQGMAITYSILGLVVASAGVQFQATLQHPAILAVIIVIFVLLALSMFGLYELQLPSRWQEKLTAMSNNQKGGNIAGVFLMGVISGLVASPCTTAPLTGILLFIAQSGDMFLGFVSLYVLSLGMGIPLILFAMTGGKLLPKAGHWMNIVKVTFGFMMLTVAVIFIERIYSSPYINILWSVIGVGAFSYYYVMNQPTSITFAKGIRSAIIFVGLFLSLMLGYQTFFGSTANDVGQLVSEGKDAHPQFIVVKDLADFEAKVASANQAGKSVMVDLYADWCVACKEFEKYTFPDPAVVEALSNTVWMQIDLTDNTPTNLSFQKEFDVLGLPTILFFDVEGNELKASRITGFMRAEPFAEHVKSIL